MMVKLMRVSQVYGTNLWRLRRKVHIAVLEAACEYKEDGRDQLLLKGFSLYCCLLECSQQSFCYSLIVRKANSLLMYLVFF